MKKGIKILFITLCGIGALFLLAGVLLVTLVNPNDFKTEIAQLVHKQTGRTLAINGKIAWSFFPWVGLSINNATLSNPKPFNQSLFVEAQQIDLSIRLIPLLSGHVAIGKAALKNATINLIENKKGQKNWLFMQQSSTNTADTVTTHKAKTKPISISARSIRIDNATIHYYNAKTAENFVIKKFNLQSFNVAFDNDFTVKTNFIASIPQLKSSFQVSISSKLFISPRQKSYQLTDCYAAIDWLNPKLSSGRLHANLSGNISYDGHLQQIKLTQALLSIANMQLEAHALISDINHKRPQLRGSITLKPFNLKDLLAEFDQQLTFKSPAALQKVSFHTDFSGNSQHIVFKPFKLDVDQSKLHGLLSLNTAGKTTLSYQLKLNKIALDHYLPTAAAHSHFDSKLADKKNQPITKPAENPLTFLREININGKLQIAQLEFNKLAVHHLAITSKTDNGLLYLAPIYGEIYGGRLNMAATLNARSKRAKYHSNVKIERIKLADITTSPRITGTINLSADLSTEGTASDWLKHLNGGFRLNLANGQYKGINLGYQLKRIYAFLAKKPQPKASSNPNTDFGTLTADANIKQGIINNQDLALSANDFTAKGSGRINLNNQAINYRLKLMPTSNSQLANLTMIQPNETSLPLKISGTIAKPVVTPDFTAIAQQLIKGKLGKKIGDEITKQIGGKQEQGIGKALQQGINQLFQ